MKPPVSTHFRLSSTIRDGPSFRGGGCNLILNIPQEQHRYVQSRCYENASANSIPLTDSATNEAPTVTATWETSATMSPSMNLPIGWSRFLNPPPRNEILTAIRIEVVQSTNRGLLLRDVHCHPSKIPPIRATDLVEYALVDECTEQELIKCIEKPNFGSLERISELAPRVSDVPAAKTFTQGGLVRYTQQVIGGG